MRSNTSNVVQLTSLRTSMPMSCRSFARSSQVAVLGLGLASCATQRVTSPDADEPIFGSRHPTTFIVAPLGSRLHARDLVAVARVLRFYKTLDAAERALLKTAVVHRLNALVALEIQRVILERPPQSLGFRNAELYSEARDRVLQRLGKLIAIPLKTSDSHFSVAFARLNKGIIEVVADTSEIDQRVETLIEGNGVRTVGGEIATVMGAMPVGMQRRNP